MRRMKVLIVAGAILMTGCATVDLARVKLVVEPVSQICGISDREIPVHIAVRNDSRGKLKIEVDSESPPYVLNGFSYKILDDGGTTDWRHGPGSHPPVQLLTLSIGPGDSTELVASLYDLTSEDYGKSFKIQFTDVADHIFFSSSFKACKESHIVVQGNLAKLAL
ncbi:hypothetical protein GCM10010981_16950 [Dyella nitratireducens]|uniref:Uncharacterized protein n=1 Tax=Dyella nitratireducens TaxID=1849580 RepID=A0ABQ1FS10_9GAMM|nr:hypothetical protein GCM10010981_16950 [Dyella nitratireducens]GLQ43240.1 hypothetical protein GCM10007902_30900 [Dyella nitratireducens]